MNTQTHPYPNKVARIWHISQAHIEEAYQWLCAQRKHYPPNADIWDFRIKWPTLKPTLLTQIQQGDYTFSPIQRITLATEQVIHLWCAQDAFVLKLMALQLQSQRSLSPACTHVKGHGGLKHAVVQTALQTLQQCQHHISGHRQHYRYGCKTDVKHFYETIDQRLLIEQLYAQITNIALRRYLYQAIHRTVEWGGNFADIQQGISRGCPISPLLGALYLKSLDDAMTQGKHDWFYIRYMDDILILSKTRWQNRKAVKRLNTIFNQLKVTQHPDKTYIGPLSKGFDFLGYHFTQATLSLANITVRKHADRLRQLYEQQHKQKATSIEMATVLGEYRKRWLRWCTAGLGALPIKLDVDGGAPSPLHLITPSPSSHK